MNDEETNILKYGSGKFNCLPELVKDMHDCYDIDANELALIGLKYFNARQVAAGEFTLKIIFKHENDMKLSITFEKEYL